MNMKTKILAAAVTAALGAGSAHAVNVSQDGLGQVLLMPYYTVQGDNEALIAITNTTDMSKAVKVRFREAQNSKEVLDFNLYLSPYDVWVAKIMDSEDAGWGEGGAKVISPDHSCTVPRIADGRDGLVPDPPGNEDKLGEPFRPYKYAGYPGVYIADAGSSDIGRTTEGYIEVIEMGEIIKDSPADGWITHVNGVPGDCEALVERWNEVPPGAWRIDRSLDMLPPAGGLFGEINIINVNAGVEGSEPVTVLDNFKSNFDIHDSPGSGSPKLDDADRISNVFIDAPAGEEVVTDTWNEGFKAVSAVLMAEAVINGYSLNPSVGAQTQWVVTFPTKRSFLMPTPPLLPFTNNFEAGLPADEPPGPGAGFEPVDIGGFGGPGRATAGGWWDREERGPIWPDIPQTESGPDFSPTLPCLDCDPDFYEPWALPYEVNVISLFNSTMKEEGQVSDFFDSKWAYVDLGLIDHTADMPPFTAGWLKLGLGKTYNRSIGEIVQPITRRSSSRELTNANSGRVYHGLPVIGFSATVLQNAGVGVGAQYASGAVHSYERRITSN